MPCGLRGGWLVSRWRGPNRHCGCATSRGIITRLFAPLVLAASLTLKVDPHVAATFDPERALGATIDAHSREETTELFTPANTAAMRSAGFHPLSYRLATELDGEAWHWNPPGTWRNEKFSEGYWTSD